MKNKNWADNTRVWTSQGKTTQNKLRKVTKTQTATGIIAEEGSESRVAAVSNLKMTSFLLEQQGKQTNKNHRKMWAF